MLSPLCMTIFKFLIISGTSISLQKLLQCFSHSIDSLFKLWLTCIALIFLFNFLAIFFEKYNNAVESIPPLYAMRNSS